MPFDLVAGLGGPVDIDSTDSRHHNELFNPSASKNSIGHVYIWNSLLILRP